MATRKLNLYENRKIGMALTRKCRGTIIQVLRENESLTESAIKKLWPDASQVEKALLTLIADLLIEKQNSKRYRLPL